MRQIPAFAAFLPGKGRNGCPLRITDIRCAARQTVPYARGARRVMDCPRKRTDRAVGSFSGSRREAVQFLRTRMRKKNKTRLLIGTAGFFLLYSFSSGAVKGVGELSSAV